MQIVIDIDQDRYKRIMKCKEMGLLLGSLEATIAKGTPLPKGHGRLIDADKLVAYFFRPYSNEEYYVNTDMENIIKNEPTVLEADKESTDAT